MTWNFHFLSGTTRERRGSIVLCSILNMGLFKIVQSWAGPMGGPCRVQASSLAMSKPDDHRAKAEECRLQADRAFSPLDKEAWLQLAADWLAMASLCERSAID
jgi:hypothetical protein